MTSMLFWASVLVSVSLAQEPDMRPAVSDDEETAEDCKALRIKAIKETLTLNEAERLLMCDKSDYGEPGSPVQTGEEEDGEGGLEQKMNLQENGVTPWMAGPAVGR